MSTPIRFFDGADEIDVETNLDVVASAATNIVVRPKCVAFRVERLEIERGPDWLIEDVLVHGRSQFRKPGRIPGDVFALPAATLSAFMLVPFEVIQTAMDFTIAAVYVGLESPAPAFACKAHGIAARMPNGAIA